MKEMVKQNNDRYNINCKTYNGTKNLNQTQAPPAQDLNIDEILKGFSTVEGATGYVVLNSDGN